MFGRERWVTTGPRRWFIPPRGIGASHEHTARGARAAGPHVALGVGGGDRGTHQHDGHDMHAGHDAYAGHHGHGDHVAQFRRMFWIMLVIAVPVVGLSPMFAHLIG